MLLMRHTGAVAKSQVASVKVALVFIWAVLRPVPPALAACPVLWLSQKLLVTVVSLLPATPTRPPTPSVPVTAPAA